MMFKRAGLTTWVTGFCGQSSFEVGTAAVGRVNYRRRSYFALATRGSARLTSGESRYRERKEKVGYSAEKLQF